MRFAGKTVVLCVTGGIAAYKAADLTSKLHQNGATVHVLMTESATQFIAPMTFETLSGNRAVARHRRRHGDDHAACYQGAGRCCSRDEHRHV